MTDKQGYEKKKDKDKGGAAGKDRNAKMSQMHTFDRIEWLKKHVEPKKLANNSVKLKYLMHPTEMTEHNAIKKVFDIFDEDGNGIDTSFH